MDAFLKKFKTQANILPSEENNKLSDDIVEKIEDKKVCCKPWVEKYRPTKMSDIVYQHEIVSMLTKCIDSSADIPNLLFYGPPGTGKTSTIVALAKELFGDCYRERVLELNASDDRGINVIREKVKNFASTKVCSSSKSMPAIKIIILDECDSMTRDAQSALRRIMETEVNSTRFCLICNYVSRIIEPIVSRCSTFRFKLLNTDVSLNKLREICDAESVQISDKELNELISLSDGDMRRAITLLQSTALINNNQQITEQLINEMSARVPQHYVTDLITICQSNSYDKLTAFAHNLISNGYSCSQFILQLHDWVIETDQSLLSDNQKCAISEHIALTDKRLLDGADEYIQLLSTASVIINTINIL